MEALAQMQQGVLAASRPPSGMVNLCLLPYQHLLDCATWASLLRIDHQAVPLEHLGHCQPLSHLLHCCFVVGFRLTPKGEQVVPPSAAAP